jgi:hypothetical protein
MVANTKENTDYPSDILCNIFPFLQDISLLRCVYKFLASLLYPLDKFRTRPFFSAIVCDILNIILSTKSILQLLVVNKCLSSYVNIYQYGVFSTLPIPQIPYFFGLLGAADIINTVAYSM